MLERRLKKEMRKKKFSWKVLFWLILGLLLLGVVIYLVSTQMTGNAVAPNSARCTDSDNGQVYEVSGVCKDYRGTGKISAIKTDECVTSDKLKEYYCNKPIGILPSRCTAQIVTCSYGCGVYEDGARCK